MSDIAVVEVVTPTFIRRKGELTRVHKRLDKLSEDMIDFLLEQIKSDKVEMKLRMQYAEKLLGYHVQVSTLINQDNLKRMVAQIQLGNKIPLGNTLGQSEKQNVPEVDFDTVQEIT